MVRLQFDRLPVTGGGKAGFAERFVDEAGKVVAERTLITVLECIDFRIVDGLHRITVQFLEAGFHAALLRFLLGLLQFFFSQFRNDRLALVRSLDVHASGVEVAACQMILGETRGKHDLLVVVAFVGNGFVVQHHAGNAPQQFFRVGDRRFFPRLYLRIGGEPGFLALVVLAVEALQFSEFEVIQQILGFLLVVALQLLDGAADIARRRQVDGVGQLGIVAAKRSATGKHGQQQGGCGNSGTGNGKVFQGRVLLATTPHPYLS